MTCRAGGHRVRSAVESRGAVPPSRVTRTGSGPRRREPATPPCGRIDSTRNRSIVVERPAREGRVVVTGRARSSASRINHVRSSQPVLTPPSRTRCACRRATSGDCRGPARRLPASAESHRCHRSGRPRFPGPGRSARMRRQCCVPSGENSGSTSARVDDDWVPTRWRTWCRQVETPDVEIADRSRSTTSRRPVVDTVGL